VQCMEATRDSATLPLAPAISEKDSSAARLFDEPLLRTSVDALLVITYLEVERDALAVALRFHDVDI